MSDDTLDRRAFLASALGAGAFCLLPELARAQGDAIASGIPLGPPESFSFERLKELAGNLAKESFTPMAVPDREILQQIDYDAHGAISFRKEKALWADQGNAQPVRFFFPGRYFPEPVHVYALENGTAREVPFSRDLFDIPVGNPANRLEKTEGFAGFAVQDPKERLDWMAFLGASYWRTAGYSGQFGLSVRGLAMDTAIPDGPEEFPRFTRFWLEQGEDGALTTYALLESPRATGAYRIASRRDNGVIQDVSAEVFLRGDVERLGLAPLTSMYWYGKPDRHIAADWRPEVHDSDGLEIHLGNGERIWRPLGNPPRVMANSFGTTDPAGFGLMQREREFEQYQDDGVFYERRASAWVAPKAGWGEGAVTLIELPTDDEIHDNIVAFWTPSEAAVAGGSFSFEYQLTWLEDCPVPPRSARFRAVRIGRGGIPGQPRPADTVKIVCDFEPMGMEGIERGPETLPVVSASRGEISGEAAYQVVDAENWRAMFDLDFSALEEGDDEPIDMRVYVAHEGEAKTETMILQLFPSQLRALLAATG
ncbi:glucan biosynthesis protein [Salipiger sp. PrR002]|uniref:glucan biosynthesis protein n=1 Tax=Salipiger sp. PrR002 TaxID=2706489 RepID=UPI0013BA386A|nr:glucan biosynthesis protein D [Salipiger sp. PrR002]NDW01022.1 glucan biosynthesis protein D [Salipiger sp. PrR002]NDW58575.1 glucan biosynthesis protein D [Salipiger sp. PrR004]